MLAAMPRYPSFFLLGALAGFAIWLLHAPTPFPLLAVVAMVSGTLGLLVSIVYLRSFEPWHWRVKLAALRRAQRAIVSLLEGPPMRASDIRASRARS
jgi:hypothetical protein